jgi:hypothetical protein
MGNNTSGKRKCACSDQLFDGDVDRVCHLSIKSYLQLLIPYLILHTYHLDWTRCFPWHVVRLLSLHRLSTISSVVCWYECVIYRMVVTIHHHLRIIVMFESIQLIFVCLVTSLSHFTEPYFDPFLFRCFGVIS